MEENTLRTWMVKEIQSKCADTTGFALMRQITVVFKACLVVTKSNDTWCNAQSRVCCITACGRGVLLYCRRHWYG